VYDERRKRDWFGVGNNDRGARVHGTPIAAPNADRRRHDKFGRMGANVHWSVDLRSRRR